MFHAIGKCYKIGPFLAIASILAKIGPGGRHNIHALTKWQPRSSKSSPNGPTIAKHLAGKPIKKRFFVAAEKGHLFDVFPALRKQMEAFGSTFRKQEQMSTSVVTH